jgi:epoxyqueuosine reductase
MTAQVKEKALELGYSACGIIPATAFTEYQQALEEHIRTFPESKKFYEKQYSRIIPPHSSKSIIVCVRGYNQYKIPVGMERHIGKYYLFHGNIPYSNAFRAKNEFDAYLKLLGIRTVKCNVPPVRLAAVKAGLVN